MTKIQTVTGEISSAQLGITLTHEHIFNDVKSWWHAPYDDNPRSLQLVNEKVSIENIWELKHDPFINKDNCSLDNEDLALEEVLHFKNLGGGTIFEATSASIGRNPEALKRLSEKSNLNIVMGTGLYLDSSMGAEVNNMSTSDIARQIVNDITVGKDGIKAGFIGEIGVSSEFTDREKKSLIGATLAMTETGVPMQVHMPGWFRLGDQVLDLIEENGGNLKSVILCHMNPSGFDFDYQLSLLSRGAFLQYDMVGMELFYADQQVQCPSDEENAQNIKRLADAGWLRKVLVSSDIFLKMLLRKYGGPGYGHILEFFIPRLIRAGLTKDQALSLLTSNPASLFEKKN